MINVETAGEQLLPVICAGLLDNEVNRIGFSPFLQDQIVIYKNASRRFADRHCFFAVLINEKELSVEIKRDCCCRRMVLRSAMPPASRRGFKIEPHLPARSKAPFAPACHHAETT